LTDAAAHHPGGRVFAFPACRADQRLSVLIMAVHQAWYSADRRLRVELTDVRGRRLFRVIDGTLPVGEFPGVEALRTFLAERYRLDFADLVED
jgi:hypothetical protein